MRAAVVLSKTYSVQARPSFRWDGDALNSSADVGGAAYIGGRAVVIARASAMTSRPVLVGYLDCLSDL